MYVQLDCITVSEDPADLQEVVAQLAALGVRVADELKEIGSLPASMARCPDAGLVVVNLDPGPQQMLAKVGQLLRHHPKTSFLVLSRVVDAGLLMEAMQLGVREFLPMPVDERKLAASLERLASAGARRGTRLIHVLPTTGGCGATTVACNVAAALAKSGRTALIDLNFEHGAVATAFDLRPRYTISDVLGSAEKLDQRLLENALTVHEESKVAVLGRSERFTDAWRFEPPKMAALLGVLESDFDYVVVDSALATEGLHEVVLRKAHANLLVLQQNVNSVRNAERFLGAMRRMGVSLDTVRIVVNRFFKKGQAVEPQEIESAVGRPIDFTLPNDYRNTVDAMNYGHPVVLWRPRVEISQKLAELAGSLTDRKTPKNAQAERTLRWFSRAS